MFSLLVFTPPHPTPPPQALASEPLAAVHKALVGGSAKGGAGRTSGAGASTGSAAAGGGGGRMGRAGSKGLERARSQGGEDEVRRVRGNKGDEE